MGVRVGAVEVSAAALNPGDATIAPTAIQLAARPIHEKRFMAGELLQ
jgi:hypothetical protein